MTSTEELIENIVERVADYLEGISVNDKEVKITTVSNEHETVEIEEVQIKEVQKKLCLEKEYDKLGVITVGTHSCTGIDDETLFLNNYITDLRQSFVDKPVGYTILTPLQGEYIKPDGSTVAFSSDHLQSHAIYLKENLKDYELFASYSFSKKLNTWMLTVIKKYSFDEEDKKSIMAIVKEREDYFEDTIETEFVAIKSECI